MLVADPATGVWSYETVLDQWSHVDDAGPEPEPAGPSSNLLSNVYHYSDLEVAVLLSGLRGDWRGDRLAMPWRRLVEADTNGELVATFNSYVAHFGDRKRCAEALHIHRNTLRYRLDRITNLTGLELSKLPDLLKLYIGPLVDTPGHER